MLRWTLPWPDLAAMADLAVLPTPRARIPSVLAGAPHSARGREECCVCFHRTSRRTACGHWLCGRCEGRLRRRRCPYCRAEIPAAQALQPPVGVAPQPSGGTSATRRNGAPDAWGPSPGAAAGSVDDRRIVEEIRACNAAEQLHEVTLGLVAPRLPARPPTARKALLAAVARQAALVLQRCNDNWTARDSFDAATASSTVQFLAGLQTDGLLEPLQLVQDAAVDVLLATLAGSGGSGPAAPTHFGPTKRRPHSAMAAGHATAVPKISGEGSGGHLEEDLTRWTQHVAFYAQLAEAGLLPPELGCGLAEAALASLRRVLRAAELRDLNMRGSTGSRRLSLLQRGAASLERALQVCCSSARRIPTAAAEEPTISRIFGLRSSAACAKPELLNAGEPAPEAPPTAATSIVQVVLAALEAAARRASSSEPSDHSAKTMVDAARTSLEATFGCAVVAAASNHRDEPCLPGAGRSCCVQRPPSAASSSPRRRIARPAAEPPWLPAAPATCRGHAKDGPPALQPEAFVSATWCLGDAAQAFPLTVVRPLRPRTAASARTTPRYTAA